MPKVLGRYHIIGELGRGGMGVVYKAVDPKLERFIAIKCLSEELSQDELTVTRFLREARNVAALNHPHIAQIFLADEDEGRPYFVMEYVDGESLAERLARERRLMPEQALRIVTECAEALKAAHEEHIVHRDVKPGNIMLDRRGRTVLTDFGIASIMHPDRDSHADAPVMGTPGYLPPEVIKGGRADHRGDIFALGAVLYEMLAGRRLVPGSGLEDTARTLLAEDFPELGDLDEQIDEVTCGVLGRMIAPNPERRFQNYAELLAALSADPAGAGSGRTGSAPGPSPRSAVSAGADDAPTTRAAASTNPTAAVTVDVDSDAAEPPRTQTSPPPAGRRRSAKVSMAAAMVLVLALVAIAIVRLVPERWDQVTALFQAPPADATGAPVTPPDAQDSSPGSAEVSSQVDAPAETPRVSGAAERDSGMEPAEELLAGTERVLESRNPEIEPPTTAFQRLPDEGRAEPASAGDTAFDQDVTGSGAERVVSRPAEPADSAPSKAVASASPAVAGEALPLGSGTSAATGLTGALVIGQGDPVLVDPMVRSVEAALRAEGHEIVDRGFISSLASLTAVETIDLRRLARVATAAGARYAVILRAMPAGQRQLSYFGRSDTLFVVQMETLTYDLVEQQQLGATELEQVDYTVLNATEQARLAIAPRLAAIARQLGDS